MNNKKTTGNILPSDAECEKKKLFAFIDDLPGLHEYDRLFIKMQVNYLTAKARENARRLMK